MSLSPIDPISPNLTRQIYRERIMILTISSLTRSVIDSWFTAVDAWYTAAEALPVPVSLTLHDFSPTEGGSTPYARGRTHDLTLKHPALRGRSALVIAHTTYIQMSTQHLLTQLEGGIERHIFHDRAQALAWLEEWL